VKGLKPVILMSITLGMLFYSLPELEIRAELTLPTVFAFVWITMSLLVVAAHLHEILGVDEEQRQELNRVKRMKKWQVERMFRSRLNPPKGGPQG
jgi:hypothetical protein